MRNFVRKTIKGGRCNVFVQRYKSEISHEVFNIISKELNVDGNECEILEKYFEFLNEYQKQNVEDIDSKYDDYRDMNEEEKTDFINKKT